jgi:hypothetical protein
MVDRANLQGAVEEELRAKRRRWVALERKL